MAVPQQLRYCHKETLGHGISQLMLLSSDLQTHRDCGRIPEAGPRQ
jgi:hypothetical protein